MTWGGTEKERRRMGRITENYMLGEKMIYEIKRARRKATEREKKRKKLERNERKRKKRE
jgi:hypothetical protein